LLARPQKRSHRRSPSDELIEDRGADLASAADHQDHQTPNLSGEPSGANEVGVLKYSGDSDWWRCVDLDLAVAFAHREAGEGRGRLAELVRDELAVEREVGAVAGAFEACCCRVLTEEAALVRADAGDGLHRASLVDDEADRRACLEWCDLAVA